MQCSLCLSLDTSIYFHENKANQEDYYLCHNCHLIFQDPSTYLNSIDEKIRYDSHENNSEDPGYRKFLNKIVEPMLSRVSDGAIGLDYGCGPGPTISIMFKELGFGVDNYDLYFAPELKLENDKYDFITSTEVFEHFYNPSVDIDKIWGLLKKGGVLGIMTLFHPADVSKFANWWYKNDPTHVCFFSPETFGWLANKLNAELEIISDQVIFLKKL